MPEGDEIEAIRERKLESMLGGGAADQRADPGAGREAAPDEPVHARNRGHFEELTRTYGVVLADFYADWCGPCKMLEPIVAEIARETAAAVVKVDTDAHQDLAMDAGIRGVPTLFLYVDGEPVKRLVGLQDAATLRDLIQQYT